MQITIKRGDKEASGEVRFEEDAPEMLEKLIEELRKPCVEVTP